MVLMRTFLMLYSADFEDDDDDRCRHMTGKSRSSAHRAYMVVSSVSWSCWHALKGWPESPTSGWVRHQLKKLLEREYTFR